MRIVIFGLAVSSAWGNGHGALWRGLDRRPARGGHAVDLLRARRAVLRATSRPDRAARAAATLVLYSRLERGAAAGATFARRAPMSAWSRPTARTASRRASWCSTAARRLRCLLRSRHAGDARAARAPARTVGLYRPGRARRLRPGAELHRRRARWKRCGRGSARGASAPLYGSVDPAAAQPGAAATRDYRGRPLVSRHVCRGPAGGAGAAVRRAGAAAARTSGS